MSQSLSHPAAVELIAHNELRVRIEQEIRKRQMSAEELAKELDLLPSGVLALMERKTWPLEVALRVAECLKIEMNFYVKP